LHFLRDFLHFTFCTLSFELLLKLDIINGHTSNGTQSGRLVSLDAYRGAIMLMMASSGLGLAQVARLHPDSGLWRFIGRQTEHAQWAGFTLWDIIQPAFMFMVGVALPWSIAKRRARGQSFRSLLVHAIWRSLVLVLLAVFLSSAWSRRTVWSFNNVLAQIGLGYTIVFLLAFTKPRTQWLTAFGILFVYWLAFAIYPLPEALFDWTSVGVPEDWSFLTGFAAHWEKNVNFAAAFDHWFLNLFPREEPFVFSRGGYQTLNFVPSIATMIFGLLAGELLRSKQAITRKLKWLVLFGVVGVIAGKLIALVGLCPIIKRIWTPSWAICSAGWVTLILSAFVAIVEWRGFKRWTFPFVIVGLNPITLYCMWQLMGGFIRENVKRHISPHVFEVFGEAYSPVLERAIVLLVLWLIVLWMYRRKIFLRI
jgi:heparan-alpha-glucosaminide N-acetyltransferase